MNQNRVEQELVGEQLYKGYIVRHHLLHVFYENYRGPSTSHIVCFNKADGSLTEEDYRAMFDRSPYPLEHYEVLERNFTGFTYKTPDAQQFANVDFGPCVFGFHEDVAAIRLVHPSLVGDLEDIAKRIIDSQL